MTFPYLNMTGQTGVNALATYGNTVTGGWFWPMILIGLFLILFLSFKIYPTAKAFGAASFLTMIATILMGSIGLVSSKFLIGAIVVGAIGMIALFVSNHPDYG